MPEKPSDPTSSREPSAPISRREFARRAAIASAVASIAPAAAVSITPAAAHQSPQPPGTPISRLASAQPSPSAQQPPQSPLPANFPHLSPPGQAEADARFQSILAQYPDRFSEDQQSDLRRLCFVTQSPLERLRAFPTDNSTGAGLYLKPLVDREKKPKPPAQPGKTPNPTPKP